MKWSWKLGKLAGIDVYLHATFILLLVWIALMHWMAGHNPETVLAGIVFMLALFGSVLLHESLLRSDNVAAFFMLNTALEQSRQLKQPQAA